MMKPQKLQLNRTTSFVSLLMLSGGVFLLQPTWDYGEFLGGFTVLAWWATLVLNAAHQREE
ncbi:hypothetical protein [Providencia alcalifaciens]|uniref:hypothetical protein n=1 Tax=Providencia alcalifaciens TaxID=126385 RepID=UPI000449B256|nr:hypothetical protein [Providencia alcalifaciens]ETT04924.1 hypothetical protein HMPREF1562_2472 [Providencia alcalifaciens F90-2004]EUC94254.1 hypothetical protein HMPREF1567_2450 [Providencia alcalifaciens PAL-2]MTB32723.1 hypothetical protein [Providencia alcalifaciens]